MTTVDSLRTHLIDELTDLLDAETQLTDTLPKLARAATSKLMAWTPPGSLAASLP